MNECTTAVRSHLRRELGLQHVGLLPVDARSLAHQEVLDLPQRSQRAQLDALLGILPPLHRAREAALIVRVMVRIPLHTFHTISVGDVGGSGAPSLGRSQSPRLALSKGSAYAQPNPANKSSSATQHSSSAAQDRAQHAKWPRWQCRAQASTHDPIWHTAYDAWSSPPGSPIPSWSPSGRSMVPSAARLRGRCCSAIMAAAPIPSRWSFFCTLQNSVTHS